jgi:site-specific DNA-methyltransferase (adenine-specific)
MEYKIIYADPPWRYNDKRNKKGKNNPTGAGGSLKHYECMNIADIMALNINQIAEKDCMLFLWTTSPFMKEAINILEFWGFKFITIPFVWVKMRNDMSEPRKDGIGNYTLNNAEYVLLGRKGKYWRNSTKVKQILLHQKLKHSEKPEEIKKRIVQLCGDLPRIELFAREKTEGWDAWGKEIIEKLDTDKIADIGEQVGLGFDPEISPYETEAIFQERQKIIKKFLKEPLLNQLQILEKIT